ncbi:MAG: dihydrofolate reductase [Clostridia bacterium]|nr:dihydrofolate reductase [Clostridia bacterium]
MRAIVNVTPQWGIGTENRLLVHIHADMRRFRALTTGGTIIIGRKTLESFPNGAPLPNRENIVLTHDATYQAENAIILHDVSELSDVLSSLDPDTVFVCGGEQIYRQLLPYCSHTLVTLTDTSAAADRTFPNLNLMPNWILTEVGEKQYENDMAFRFLTYTNTSVRTI